MEAFPISVIIAFPTQKMIDINGYQLADYPHV